jgi:hypothetical protein
MVCGLTDGLPSAPQLSVVSGGEIRLIPLERNSYWLRLGNAFGDAAYRSQNRTGYPTNAKS